MAVTYELYFDLRRVALALNSLHPLLINYLLLFGCLHLLLVLFFLYYPLLLLLNLPQLSFLLLESLLLIFFLHLVVEVFNALDLLSNLLGLGQLFQPPFLLFQLLLLK